MKARLIWSSNDSLMNRETWFICVGDLDVRYVTHNQARVEGGIKITKCQGHQWPKVKLNGEVRKALAEHRQKTSQKS